MLKTAALVLLSIPLLLAGLIASTGLIVVDVKTEDGPRVVVPVPLFLARAVLSFAPHEATHLDMPELAEHRELAGRLLAELAEMDDAILVEVEEGREHVLIEKIGDELAIEVLDDEEEVSIRIPLAGAVEILEAYDGESLQVAGVLDALSSGSSLSGTDLVHVKSRDEEVRIWLW